MARLPRFTIDNGNYHVFCRGHNYREIFHDDTDFLKYLNILSSCKTRYKIKIFHYVLMNNHTHLILKAEKGYDLSNSMRTLNQTYAQYYRLKYGGVGYVWQGRFKSFLIQDGIYLLECGRYIELNPVRAGIVKNPEDYKWSSCRAYVSSFKDNLIDFDPEYSGLSSNVEKCRKIYAEFLKEGLKERRRLERYFRAGVYGDEKFINLLKEKGLRQIDWQTGRPSKK